MSSTYKQVSTQLEKTGSFDREKRYPMPKSESNGLGLIVFKKECKWYNKKNGTKGE